MTIILAFMVLIYTAIHNHQSVQTPSSNVVSHFQYTSIPPQNFNPQIGTQSLSQSKGLQTFGNISLF